MSSTFLRGPAVKRSIALIGAGALAMGTFGFAVAPAHAAPVRADLSATCEGLTQSPFTDIGAEPADTQDAISCLFNYEITQGLTDTTYGPRFEVTRQQMAIFIARQVGYVVENSALEAPTSVPASDFSDRDELTAEGRASVDLLAELGVIRGNTDGTYDGERSITRGEMAVFINRVQNVIAAELGADAAYDADEADTVFNDVDDEAFYAESVYALQSVGIVQGTSATDDTFSPDAPVLRNQMAFFIMRHLDENIVEGRVDSLAVPNVNPVFTEAPELVSVSAVEAEVVEFRFDEPVTGQALDRLVSDAYPGFKLYNSAGAVSYPLEARIDGDRVLARYTAQQVSRAAVAAVRYNAVEDVQGTPNVEAGFDLQPSALPSAVPFEAQLTNVGNYAQSSVTNPDGTVDITVDFTFGPGPGGAFDDAAAQYDIDEGLEDAAAFDLILNNGSDVDDAAKEIVEVDVDEATDITTVTLRIAGDPRDVPESQIRRGTFVGTPAGGEELILAQTWESLNGNTTDPDLVSVERISETMFRYTFDEAVSAASGAIVAGQFSLYNEDGDVVDASSAGRSTLAADNASVVVATFAGVPEAGGEAPVGAFVDTAAVVGTDNLGSVNAGANQPDEEVLTTPVGPDAPPAGITALPDLVGVERDVNVVTENSSITFVFDQSIVPVASAINFDLYDEAGTQFRVLGAAGGVISTNGREVTFSADASSVFNNEQIVAAVTAAVEDNTYVAQSEVDPTGTPFITERQSVIAPE